eukprot:s835_g4.t3
MCIEMIQQLDQNLQVAPIIVPADGNCLVWSLRCLFLEKYTNISFKTKASLKSAAHVRDIIKQMWTEKKTDQRWQTVFEFCYADHLQKNLNQKQPGRPAKLAKRPADPAMEIESSPEKAPKTKPKLQIAAAAVPVPITAREPASPTLKDPNSVRTQAFLEPAVPDLEDMLNADLLKGPPKGKKNGKKIESVCRKENVEVQEDDLKAEPDEIDEFAKKRLTRHRRMMKKRPHDPQRVKQQRLNQFLASMKFGYPEFMRLHRRCAVFKKAGTCADKGFQALKDNLLSGKMPKCEICLGWMSDHGVSHASVSEYVSNPPDAPAAPAVAAEEGEAVAPGQQAAEEGEAGAPAKRKRSKAEVREECLAYIEAQPHIKAVDGAVLKYHCEICTSKKQPQGKVNVLGAQPTLNQVKTFISDHLTSQGHVKALAALMPEKEESEEMPQPVEGDEELKCPGYCVSDPKSTGTLHMYKDEFHIWATHTKLEGKAAHSYWQDASNHKWYVWHKNCSGLRPDLQSMCCRLCESLGEPKAIQRLVVSFLRNFHSANLLSQRLYGTPEEQQEFIDQVEASAFGQFNCSSWEKLQSLPLHQLQAFVQGSYGTYPDHIMTSNMRYFIATVVRPCLKVNVTCLDAGLARVSAQFVHALANRRLNDAVLKWQQSFQRELDEINVRIADAAVRGQLDASPFLQGILLQMLRKLDKDRRSVSMVGRPMACTATEHMLISDAAFTFSMAGKNKELAAQLGQQLRPKSLSTEELPSHSLPNPTLALLSNRSEHLRDNLQMIHRRFSMVEGQQHRRLVCAFDHTYLSRQLCQAKFSGKAGLLGPAWNPCGNEDRCFLEFGTMPRDGAKTPAAALMLECLCWNPCEDKNRCFSICSMPMALKAALLDDQPPVKPRNFGKWVS